MHMILKRRGALRQRHYSVDECTASGLNAEGGRQRQAWRYTFRESEVVVNASGLKVRFDNPQLTGHLFVILIALNPALIEPHGDLSRGVLDTVPAERLEDVVYVNLGDLEYPPPLNPLESLDDTQHHLIASGLVSIFKRFWGTSIGPRSEYLIRNSLLALLERPGTTLLELQPASYG